MPRRPEALSIATLRPVDYDRLAGVRDNPRFALWPIQRQLYRRLGLIEPIEPPRTAVKRGQRQRPRAHRLTELGAQVLAAADFLRVPIGSLRS